MQCIICNKPSSSAFTHTVLNTYTAEYDHCQNCDFLRVTNPTWLDKAYESPIDETDTGYVNRNIYLSKKTLILLFSIFSISRLKKDKFLDYAGGYGMLTRIMRDYGLDYYWDDLFTQNMFSKGFEYNTNNIANNLRIKAISCFECFEHFVDPIQEVNKMLKISNTIFFSTRLRATGKIPDEKWEYYGFNHGQHLSFYSERTFNTIAAKLDLYYFTDHDNLHILTSRKLPKNILRIVNLLTKMQLDIFIRKILTSKTVTDQLLLSR